MNEGWQESGGILLLVTKMRHSFIVNIGGLSESERTEPRDILKTDLPPKK